MILRCKIIYISEGIKFPIYILTFLLNMIYAIYHILLNAYLKLYILYLFHMIKYYAIYICILYNIYIK